MEGQLGQDLPDQWGHLEAMTREASSDVHRWVGGMSIDDVVLVGGDRVGAGLKSLQVVGSA